MIANRKEVFVTDSLRESFINVIHNRIHRGKSSLIIGTYGSGKTRLLDKISVKKKRIVRVNSVQPVHIIFSDILSQLGRKVNPRNLQNKGVYLNMILQESFVMLIDEANDLRPEFYPYLKRIMDSGSPAVLAGLDDERRSIEAYLSENVPDIYSRFRVLRMKSVDSEDLKKSMPKFEPDAIDMIYGAAGGNLRIFHDLCDDCADKALEMKSEKVTVAIAAMFV
jgi:Cdc6-like AAA superfamily ATPase